MTDSNLPCVSSSKPQLVGIDLSGPANHADTCLAWRNAQGRIEVDCGCSDAAIIQWAKQSRQPLVLFIDAPLSYQDGGGYRPCDSELRRFLNAQGFARVGVMAPTMTKMVYLTLRGISLAQQLTQLGVTVIETHPGASLLLSGMAAEQVYALKTSPSALKAIQSHWQGKGIEFHQTLTSDHQIMAVQSLLTAERWMAGQTYWHCDQWIV